MGDLAVLRFDDPSRAVDVRADLPATHRALLEAIRRPGNFFTGAERLAIAKEGRAAAGCGLCRERKAALSPERAQGSHDRVSELPDVVVEVAHRVREDSGRLSKAWFERRLAAGIDAGAYVEIVGITAFVAGLDHFCRALGTALYPLPDALPGEPSHDRPENLSSGIAWVPMLAPEDATGPEATLYNGDFIPNIVRALSLVPDHVRLLQLQNDAHYIPLDDMQNPSAGRDLTRIQIELVAARVSALNECFY